MAPIKPHWAQPSHPDVQEVIVNEAEYTSKSLSKVSLPPFSVFAKMAFPPCTVATEPTYATVQMGRDSHLNLNSDLLYINHSLNVLVGPKGLEPGDELSFFYPSTEWEMAQAFQCLCNTSSCRGTISGAKHMSPSQLEGYWLNAHIRHLLEEHHQQQKAAASAPENGPSVADPTAQALRSVLGRAELAVDAARSALRTYLDGVHGPASLPVATNGATKMGNGVGRRGPTSRELSGEMGGDTITA
ncbi:hypothetical protein ACO1O0_006197 [Amphichorda felina]